MGVLPEFMTGQIISGFILQHKYNRPGKRLARGLM
jgi:hypothetical protein